MTVTDLNRRPLYSLNRVRRVYGQINGIEKHLEQ